MRHYWWSLCAVLSLLSSCEYERIEPDVLPENAVLFIKSDGADPTLPENQDRITDNVWLTRGNEGGQIYNAREEASVSKSLSPSGTEWALGTTEELESLTFDVFRNTVRPKEVVGKNMVLHLLADDIYLDIRFTAWTGGKGGGFAYVRSPTTTDTSVGQN